MAPLEPMPQRRSVLACQGQAATQVLFKHAARLLRGSSLTSFVLPPQGPPVLSGSGEAARLAPGSFAPFCHGFASGGLVELLLGEPASHVSIPP